MLNVDMAFAVHLAFAVLWGFLLPALSFLTFLRTCWPAAIVIAESLHLVNINMFSIIVRLLAICVAKEHVNGPRGL